jgi:hypothetical protein
MTSTRTFLYTSRVPEEKKKMHIKCRLPPFGHDNRYNFRAAVGSHRLSISVRLQNPFIEHTRPEIQLRIKIAFRTAGNKMMAVIARVFWTEMRSTVVLATVQGEEIIFQLRQKKPSPRLSEVI